MAKKDVCRLSYILNVSFLEVYFAKSFTRTTFISFSANENEYLTCLVKKGNPEYNLNLV